MHIFLTVALMVGGALWFCAAWAWMTHGVWLWNGDHARNSFPMGQFARDATGAAAIWAGLSAVIAYWLSRRAVRQDPSMGETGAGQYLLESTPIQMAGMVMMTVCAALIYGIIHDQVTARICVEYFTIGHPRLINSDSPTVLGLFWGVVATWWMGLPIGLGVGIAARAGQRPKLTCAQMIRPIGILLCCMFGVAIVAGLIGYLTSSAGVFELVEGLASRIPEDRHVAFLTNGWAHSGSYFAGLIGGIVLWIRTWKRRGREQARADS